uniref:Uncharacterized protein n=1 Tax=Candidatus Kentrum sp. LPFa TaxID=2126335 RepID=A0A450X376_9GAMM|nr:MAG: hypothetical protein BECKLPF1236A_GA0070988_1000711 [Candidatus Kentron sp. LPFa]VFK23691.1 MAG: hypothetical protein BECKLPF1236C_GA0070990_1000711 [Candidatus Kentron sp. LPFa]
MLDFHFLGIPNRGYRNSKYNHLTGKRVITVQGQFPVLNLIYDHRYLIAMLIFKDSLSANLPIFGGNIFNVVGKSKRRVVLTKTIFRIKGHSHRFTNLAAFQAILNLRKQTVLTTMHIPNGHICMLKNIILRILDFISQVNNLICSDNLI